MNYSQLRQEAYQTNMDLASSGLVFLTFGNASCARDGIMAIKPSGVGYSCLKAENIPILEIETGRVLEGELNPSSDTPTHLHLYRNFPDIGGIIHTHSHFATVFAQSGKSVACYGTTHADYFRGSIPVSRRLSEGEVSGSYEVNTGKVICEYFSRNGIDPAEIPGILVNQHGPFAWGKDGSAALLHARVLEETARLAFHCLTLSERMTPLEDFLTDKHFLRKHGKNAYYGQGKI